MEKISHYCQKCRAANTVGERACRRCGTRLMLVVFPPSMRHDEGIIPSYYEDHLLERVSLLELQLAQVLEKIGMAYEFFARESKELQKDHKFIRAFSDALKEINPRLAEELSQKQNGIVAEKPEKLSGKDKENQQLGDLLARHSKPNSELFSHLLKEGIRLLEEREEKQAFQMLRRSALLSPENVPLLVFVAENLYRADKFEESKNYLEQAFELEPGNEKILLLRGAVCADCGETERARKFLGVLAGNDKTIVPVNFVWGITAAFEEKWSEALAAFKLALGYSEIPELHYLVGCVYFQLENFHSALQFFQKTAALDVQYSDAYFMQSVIYSIQNDVAAEEKMLGIIPEIRESGAQCTEFLTGKKTADLKTALPFQHFKNAKKQLLTGGAPRLAKFFRQQIFKAIE